MDREHSCFKLHRKCNMLRKHLNRTQTIGRALFISLSSRLWNINGVCIHLCINQQLYTPNQVWLVIQELSLTHFYHHKHRIQHTTAFNFAIDQPAVLVCQKRGLCWRMLQSKLVKHRRKGSNLVIKTGFSDILFCFSPTIACLPLPFKPQNVSSITKHGILVMAFVNPCGLVGMVRGVI